MSARNILFRRLSLQAKLHNASGEARTRDHLMPEPPPAAAPKAGARRRARPLQAQPKVKGTGAWKRSTPEYICKAGFAPSHAALRTLCSKGASASQMMMVFNTGQPYRLLLGREALVLQGFPSRDPSLSELIEGTTELLMTNIAGNMVSTPVMLAIAMAAISSVSWRSMPRPHEAHASTSGETALALLRSIAPLASEDSESED